MFRKNLQLTIRRMRQSKLTSIVNLMGLCISMTSFFLIVNYLWHETRFDVFHQHADRIYRVESKIYDEGVLTDHWASTPFGCATAMRDELTGIEDLVRVTVQRPQTENIVSVGDTHYREYNCCYTEPSFFRLFSFPLLKGNTEQALSNPNTVVITQSMAAKYFGNGDPMGKVLTFKTENSVAKCEVTGVLDDIPANSHLHFDFYISWTTLPQWIRDFWPIYGVYTYALLRPGVSPKSVENQFALISEKYTTSARMNSKSMQLAMLPLRDIHFAPQKPYEREVKGNSTNVYVLAVIAVALLVIAWFNYVNLSTAVATERIKEYTIRKLSGASAGSLLNMFISDSLVTNLFAVAISVVAAWLCLPLFNRLTGQLVPFDILTQSMFWLPFVGVLTLGIALTGFAPQWLLRRIKPSSLVNGRGMPRESGWSRKVLVCFQFSASIVLIAVTILVFKQISFMRNQSLGYETAQTLAIKFPGQTENYMQKIDLFRKDVRNLPGVEISCLSGVIPGMEVANYAPVRRQGAANQKDQLLQFYPVDFDFISTYGLNVLAGRAIAESFGDDRQKLMLNEEAARYFGFASAEEAIGQQLVVDSSRPMEVVGVVNNFHQQSPEKAFLPIIFVYQGTIPWLPSKFISVKISGNPEQTLAGLSDKWASLFPESSFDYFFVDEFFNRQYQSNIRFGKVFGIFSSLTIFIACLGLFALSLFASRKKTKEIGIRKVNGAGNAAIVFMLNRSCLILVMVGFAGAVLPAWWIMKNWLGNFAMQTSVDVWIFALAGLLALAIALLTVSWQSWKAATRNPVEALRYE
ncbi:MAG: ABC transporter permease [Prolixibacteraceae bacterium]|nr:ABC transporter permease [Prolixibacteraceae bacterium]